MKNMMPKMTKDFYIDNKKICELKEAQAEQRMQKWLDFFNDTMRSFDATYVNRFIRMQNDVWYDYMTGVLLPEFDKYICRVCTVKSFEMFARKNIIKQLKINFSGFSGRLISLTECKSIFAKEINHPYKAVAGNYLAIKGAYSSLEWEANEFGKAVWQKSMMKFLLTEKIELEKFCKNRIFKGGMLFTKDFDCNGAVCTVYNIPSGQEKNISWNNTMNIYGLVIPVYPLTKAHIDDTIKKERWDVWCELLKANVIPKKLPVEIKSVYSKLKTEYAIIKDYIQFDEITESFQLDKKKLCESLGAGECKIIINGQLLQNLFCEGTTDVSMSIESAKEVLLNIDTCAVNLSPYPESILEDSNLGHWELFEQRGNSLPVGMSKMKLEQPLPARSPELDICDSGICAIDFGTKSTVVICRNKEERLLRVGKGDYRKAPTKTDYENPTVIEFRDVVNFQKKYAERNGRPFTQWNDITVSHQALARLLENDDSRIAQSVFSELKQWANMGIESARRLNDQRGNEIILKSYGSIDAGEFDPIEIYAYYLGRYINNMTNGIYLEYILSFPVNYRKDVRKRLLYSFEQGLKKSLPPSILENKEWMNEFCVYAGATEPAAYAACALKELGKKNEKIRPLKDSAICYGVFDFGGGTTDFDYGIWRLPTAEDKGNWNFVIEHFGAGGDVNLGGEKLLALMAYEVFKENVDIMRTNNIPFALPDGAAPFAGSEFLLSKSESAYLNTRRISERLRPIWEAQKGYQHLGDKALNIYLFAEKGLATVSLHINVSALEQFLEKRIQRGIENFFVKMLQSFKEIKTNHIDILLAGNACKSAIVQKLFHTHIVMVEKDIQNHILIKNGQRKDSLGVFRLHLPLGIEENDDVNGISKYDRYPTGKTGVVFGLLDCYRGGNDVKVIDHNLSDAKESPFRYYLGYSDSKDNFHVNIGMDVEYGIWAPFFLTDYYKFELYYTAEPKALKNDVPIEEAKRKKCRIHYSGDVEAGMIYIRKIAPTKIQYTVATEDGIGKEEYMAKIEECELE